MPASVSTHFRRDDHPATELTSPTKESKISRVPEQCGGLQEAVTTRSTNEAPAACVWGRQKRRSLQSPTGDTPRLDSQTKRTGALGLGMLVGCDAGGLPRRPFYAIIENKSLLTQDPGGVT